MNSQPITVNRTMVGVIGAVLLTVAGILTLAGSEGTQEMWAGACLKVGLVMVAFWLALPSITRHQELGRASLTTLLGVLAAAIIVARTRIPLWTFVPVLIGTVVVFRFLRPRQPPSDRPRRTF